MTDLFTNRDKETGIRYGFINANALTGQAVDDVWNGMVIAPGDDEQDAPALYEENGYRIRDMGDGVWAVEKSPYETRCALCSPCAPGAGDLDTPQYYGERTYCLGPDFFEVEVKYPVIDVATGGLIYAPMRWKFKYIVKFNFEEDEGTDEEKADGCRFVAPGPIAEWDETAFFSRMSEDDRKIVLAPDAWDEREKLLQHLVNAPADLAAKIDDWIDNDKPYSVTVTLV